MCDRDSCSGHGFADEVGQSIEEDSGKHSCRDPQITYAYQEGLRCSSVCVHGMVKSRLLVHRYALSLNFDSGSRSFSMRE